MIAAVTPDPVAKQMFAGVTATVMVGGHTHIQMLRRYEDMYLVSAGGPELPFITSVWAKVLAFL